MASWIQSQRRRRFVRTSVWLTAVVCMAAALLAAPPIRWIDEQTHWTLLGFGPEGARAAVGALASSLLSFIVFAFSIVLLAVQMASGQLSPRIIDRVFDDRVTKLAVGAFVFAWAYSTSVLGRVEDRVPQLPIALAIGFSLVSVGLFLYLVQRVAKGMRPVTILAELARDMRAAIQAIYPVGFSTDGGPEPANGLKVGQLRRTIKYRGKPGVVLQVDVSQLVEIAARTGGVIEIVPQTGDFLATGEGLFHVYGAAANAVDEQTLCRCVDLGGERTLEHDLSFGFRIIVDIACRALSPGVNDPTTAVQAIDQLHYLLSLLAQRQIDSGVVRDASGQVRFLYRTPDWDDFITLAATEIRLSGARSPQVMRRLRAMFDDLLVSVPEPRRMVLRNELGLLRDAVDRAFHNSYDRAVASCPDLQALGSGKRVPDLQES